MLDLYFNEMVILIRSGVPEKWLKPGDTEEKEVPGRVDWKNQDVRNEVGETVKSSAEVLLDYDETFWFTEKIKVNGVEHAVIKIVREQDFSPDHLKVYLA